LSPSQEALTIHLCCSENSKSLLGLSEIVDFGTVCKLSDQVMFGIKRVVMGVVMYYLKFFSLIEIFIKILQLRQHPLTDYIKYK
jgi:hypothetical protein